ARIEPLLRYIGSDVTHCGAIGCGQVVKLINNTLVFEHVVALAEMMVVAERAGVAPDILLQAVPRGSGDSFVLRNHGMKAMLPRSFPERSFPPELDFSQKLNVPSRGGQRGTSDRSRRFRERSRASTSCGPCFQKSSSDPWRLTSRKARSGQWLEWGTGALSGLQCGDRGLCTPCRSFQHHSG